MYTYVFIVFKIFFILVKENYKKMYRGSPIAPYILFKYETVEPVTWCSLHL